MSPFRNELEALHASIARLEAEKQILSERHTELEARLKKERRTYRKVHPGWAIAVLSAVLLAWVNLVFTIAAHHYHAAAISCPCPASHPLPVRHPSPVRDRYTPPARSPNLVPTWKAPPHLGKGECYCPPGDPMCTCL